MLNVTAKSLKAPPILQNSFLNATTYIMYTVKTCIKRTDVGQRKGGLLIFYDR
jgi:hypothetical protein